MATKNINDKVFDKVLIKLAFETANIGICLIDLNGNVFKVNRQIAIMFGYTEAELETMNVNDLAHPDYTRISPKFIREAREGKITQSVFEKHYIHKKGNTIICLVTSSVAKNKKGIPLYFISHIQDITEKRKIELELLKAKEIAEKNELKLKKLNATKSKLFSIIAHDLITPFNSILGFSEILMENIKENNYSESEEYLDIISSSAKHTLTLLNNLLNWEKSQTGKINYTPQKINISETVKEIAQISSSSLKLKDITLNRYESGIIEVFTDENMVKTVLRNLISNAIKFTKPGGTINIIIITKSNDVEITISDNGVGMDEQTCDKLFDIATNTTLPGTSDERGSGLGLVLCKEFIEQLGGKIWVESKPNKGSSFKFTLPLEITSI